MTETLIIGGSGRSGTTFLKTLLKNNLPKAWDGNFEPRLFTHPNGLFRLLDLFSTSYTYPLYKSEIDNCIKALSNRLKRYGSLVRVLPLTQIINKRILCECQDEGKRCVILDVHTTPEQQRDLIQTILNQTILIPLHEEGYTHWIEKTPWDSVCFDKILKYTNAKCIHIWRHPMDTIDSVVRQGWGPNNIRDATLWYLSWLKAFSQIEDKVRQSSRYLEINYEKLTQESDKVWSKIADFLDLEKKVTPSGIRPVNIGRYKKRWKEQDINFFQQNVETLAKEIGFM